MMTEKYGAIMADPPWAFRTYSNKRGTTPHRGDDEHYATMRLHEIAGIPVPDFAASNCVLFLWVVDSHLEEAFLLLRAWGFTYKTVAFVWEKITASGDPRIGMGYWTRKSTEQCWLVRCPDNIV